MNTCTESLQHPSHHPVTATPAGNDARLAGLAILASAIVSATAVALDRGASGKTTLEILQSNVCVRVVDTGCNVTRHMCGRPAIA